MKTEMIETGDLSSQITITIDPTDYKAEFDSGLKKHRKEAHLKGFRKGKTPLSAIRKMYGKGVLADIINDKLQKALADYLTENKINILGNPIPAEDQPFVEFETRQLESFEFKFDLGLSPTITVDGADNTVSYDQYIVSYGEDRIDEEIEQLQKRGGTQEEIEAPIEELDVVTVEVTESHVEERDAWSGEITIMPERLTEESKEMVLGKTKGDAIAFDIYNLEKDTTEDYVKKYFLKDAPDYVGKDFTGEISAIKRLVPAEINDEFFEKMFDPKDEIKDIEGVRELIRKDLDKFYENQGKAITQRKILEALIEKNKTDLPDAFLKRWLMSTKEGLTLEQLEKEYEDFTKNLTWTLVKQELAKKFEINIPHEAIKEGVIEDVKKQLSQYGYGMMGDFDYEGVAQRMMQKQETVEKKYEELLATEVINRVVEEVSLTDITLTLDEYKELVEQMQ